MLFLFFYKILLFSDTLFPLRSFLELYLWSLLIMLQCAQRIKALAVS